MGMRCFVIDKKGIPIETRFPDFPGIQGFLAG